MSLRLRLRRGRRVCRCRLSEIGASDALVVCPRRTLSPRRCSSLFVTVRRLELVSLFDMILLYVIALLVKRSVREVVELYVSEKSFVVEVQRALSGLHSTALIAMEISERFYAKLQRKCLELTQATPDQSVDDEAVYFNVAGECPKGRVYGGLCL
ncbi:hypothetical protein Scep_018814 [Stephania cephalantha]|uniref:Uncharacterized protein n=1 Tax=Stephania cephalantha TaxID=152367 RepID=A0AAP0NMM0_9MAGN